MAKFIDGINRIIIKLSDSDEDQRLFDKYGSNAKEIISSFHIFMVKANTVMALGFWIEISFIVELCRLILGIREAMIAPTDTNGILWYYVALYAIVLANTVVAVPLSLMAKKNPEKHYKFYMFATEIYILVYLLRGVCFMLLDAEYGFVGYSLVVALFIAGYSVYMRPSSTVVMTLITMASIVFAILFLDTEFFDWRMGLRVLIVATLSCVTACVRYRSKFKTFLSEKSIIEQRDKLSELNEELKRNEEKIESQNRKLQYMSVTDSLTGIPNRRCFTVDSEVCLKHMCEQQRFLTFAVVDIDDFKKINDKFGHVAGDKCLMDVGKAFHKIRNENTNAYRFGGDEFVVIFCGASKNEAMLAMDKFSKEVSNIRLADSDHIVTTSVGIYSEIPKPSMTVDYFVEKADEHLYKAKRDGKNRIEF